MESISGIFFALALAIASISPVVGVIVVINPSRRGMRCPATGAEATVNDQDSVKEELFIEAVDAFGDKKLDEAIRLYQRALEIDPQYQDALHGLARAQFDNGNVDDAIDTAKRLTAIDADDILAHTSLSMFYHSKGMIEEAEREGNVARVLGWKQDLKKPQEP